LFLTRAKNITLDIDASEVITNKANTQWTYKDNKGYMLMAGHRQNGANSGVSVRFLLIFFTPIFVILFSLF